MAVHTKNWMKTMWGNPEERRKSMNFIIWCLASLEASNPVIYGVKISMCTVNTPEHMSGFLLLLQCPYSAETDQSQHPALSIVHLKNRGVMQCDESRLEYPDSTLHDSIFLHAGRIPGLPG